MTIKKENPDWPEVESTLLPIDGVALIESPRKSHGFTSGNFLIDQRS